VPAPNLAFKPIAGVFAPLESPVGVSFAAVRFPDGSAMAPDDLTAAQAIVSRVRMPGGGSEIWDATAKVWRPVVGLDQTTLAGVPLLPPKAGDGPWAGLLVAAGQTDAAGAPQIEGATAHYPFYRVRGLFRARRGADEAVGLGPESPPIEFASAVAAARFAAELTPAPDSATRVRIVLRNGAAQPVGALDIDASGGNAVVTLATYDAGGSPMASVVIQADGSIRLTPVYSKRVVVAGDLQAEHIFYVRAADASGQPRVALP
jgi:hypothetical protein